MSSYLLFKEPMKYLVPRGSGRPVPSSVSATVAKMTRVFWRRATDVINEEIAATLHLDVDGPLTTV